MTMCIFNYKVILTSCIKKSVKQEELCIVCYLNAQDLIYLLILFVNFLIPWLLPSCYMVVKFGVITIVSLLKTDFKIT